MGLLDFFKRKPAVPEAPVVEDRQGTGGTVSYGGFLQSKEASPDLQGEAKYTTFDNVILNSTVAAAAVRYYHALITGVGWSLKPGDGANAQKYAERIDKMIKTEMRAPWNQSIGRLGHYKWVGFAVLEWIAEMLPDGFVGLTSLENRPQATIQRWDLEPQSGHVLGFIQRDPQDGKEYYLPRWKSVYLADQSITNSPEGVGMLRHVVETDRQRKRLEQLEGWLYETDLRGVPIGRAPIGVLDDLVRRNVISEEDKKAKLKGLSDFIQNHIKNPQLGIILDSLPYMDQGQAKQPSSVHQWGLEIAHAGASGFAEIGQAIERKNREIARALGFEHIMLGGDGKGSNAQHTDKTANVREMMNATLATMAWQLDQDLIVPIFEMNGWDVQQRPSLQPDALQLRSVQEVVDALEGMARSGAVIMPNDEVVNQIRDMLHLVRAPKITPEMMGMLQRSPGNEPGNNQGKSGKPGEEPKQKTNK